MFKPIDCMLLLIGCKLYTSRFTKVLNNFIFIASIANLSFHITAQLCDLEIGRWLLSDIFELIQSITIVLQSLLIRSKRHVITKMLNQLSNQITYSDLKKYLRKVSIVLFVIFSCCFMIIMSMIICGVIMGRLILVPNTLLPFHEKCKKFTMYELVYSFVQYAVFSPFEVYLWPLYSCFLYSYLIVLIHKSEDSHLKDLTERIKFNNSINHAKCYIPTHKQFRDLKLRFESTFNIFPMLWFSILFIECSRLISWGRGLDSSDNSDFNWIYMDLVAYSMKLMAAFGVCSLHDRLNSQTSSHALELYDICSKYQISNDFELVEFVAGLKTMKMKLTGGSMFNLSKSLILNFIGSILTFTVLFIQLSENRV